MIYEFGRYGTLLRRNGLPIYVGDELICGRARFVWWWPVNWLVVLCALPVIVWNRWRKSRTGSRQ